MSKTMNYRVRWEIDIDAENATQAAEKALEIQQDMDPQNDARVFEVAENPHYVADMDDFKFIQIDLNNPSEE